MKPTGLIFKTNEVEMRNGNLHDDEDSWTCLHDCLEQQQESARCINFG